MKMKGYIHPWCSAFEPPMPVSGKSWIRHWHLSEWNCYSMQISGGFRFFSQKRQFCTKSPKKWKTNFGMKTQSLPSSIFYYVWKGMKHNICHAQWQVLSPENMQWRIQNFPGASTPEAMCQPAIWPFSPETAWKWRNFGRLDVPGKCPTLKHNNNHNRSIPISKSNFGLHRHRYQYHWRIQGGAPPPRVQFIFNFYAVWGGLTKITGWLP